MAPTLPQAIDARSAEFERDRVIERIWARDYTVWRPDPADLADRLGWLDVARESLAKREEFERFATGAAADGLESVLLLGMGGSSLGPEVIREVFGKRLLDLVVLDSTHPTDPRD